MIWLRIAGAPPRQFYADARALPYLTATEARHEWLEGVGELRAGIDGESPGITVTLRNRNGESARLFALPPITAAAEIHDENGLIFAGVVASIDMGDDCRVEVQA